MLKSAATLFLAFTGLLLGSGCAQFSTRQGVESDWHAPTANFTSGESTQSDVMAALGPPSQIISVNGKTVFYYLRERGEGKARIFIIYNDATLNTDYERAVFFFDADGVLEEFAMTAPVDD